MTSLSEGVEASWLDEKSDGFSIAESALDLLSDFCGARIARDGDVPVWWFW